jgi:hypothetical protein
MVNRMDYQDRSPILVVFGVLLLLVGVGAALLGPIEIYCFYLFAEGGRLHYEGFGFGSFMFGNIAAQIIGYYLIAALLIPLGYGHLKVRRWARTLALTLVRFWLVVGMPLTVIVLFILVSSKDLSLVAGVMAVIALALSYLLLPGLLLRFYQSPSVRLTFESRDPNTYWIERLPRPALVLGALYVFYISALHVLILFNGIFPLFGVFVFDLQGILLLSVSIVILYGLVWGTLRLRPWAWWGGLAFFGLLTSSSIVTLLKVSYLDVLSEMKFAPTEMEALQGIPLQGFHFAVFFGIPLLLTLGVIIFSKRHFEGGNRTAPQT